MKKIILIDALDTPDFSLGMNAPKITSRNSYRISETKSPEIALQFLGVPTRSWKLSKRISTYIAESGTFRKPRTLAQHGAMLILVVATLVGINFAAFAGEENIEGKVKVYYFHTTMRCSTCHKLEQYSRQAIETNFKNELRSGKLEFKAINVDDRGNEHYTNDYQLYTKSLILSLIQDGKEKKWKNLDKIWEYVGNKQKFIDYIKSNVADFLKEDQ